ncbi:serine hydrolase [Streptomyces sp. NPDC059894]|uniref:serine hydrolase n=1 Tax=unclassified Streptomyces TaxID=2593676 RepID=UPI00364FCA42
MEEASVAGESPDRSKQRESSEEPTSGSAGTVPEARDPRIPVTRENEASTSASGSSRGGVDTATRVFSVRDLKTEGEDEGDGEDTADDSADSADSAEGAGSTEAASADTEGREKPEGARKASTAPETAGAAEAAGGAREEASGAPTAASGGSGAPDGGDTRLKAAVAQWVASADGEGGDGAGEADGTGETDATGDDTAVGTDAEAEADADTDADADAGPAPEAKSAPKAAPKWAAGSDGNTEAETESGPETGSGPTTDEPKSDEPKPAKADAPKAENTKTESTKADEAPASPVDQPTAVFKAVRPPAPAVDQPTTMLKLGGAAKADAKPASKADAKPDEKADAKPGTGKQGPKAEPEADAEPEAEAERTSKFVALKPLDDPSTRKPKPAEPATPNAPGKTPGQAPGKAPGKAPGTAPAEATAVVPQIGPERTTQQPLPPKPPLDLLAELTNTPPPPPTPLRTFARRVKIWTPLVILLVIVFAIVQVVRPLPATALTLTAKDSYTFEGGELSLPWPDEGQGWMDVDGIGTMDGFGEQNPVAIGSVAKAMTAYVVLKDHALKSGEEGPSVPVDATAEKEGGYDADGESTLNTVKEGDKLTLRQALSAIMIPSANNIARLLARWDAGTEAEFIEKMNATAKELGMKNTTYTDASGLKETTVSTAEDQVKLGNELVKIPALMEITRLPEWTDPSGQKWRNYNTLVPYNGAIGIKTGSTTKAGGNLLFAATKEVGGETVTLVGAVLGQHKPAIIDTVNAVSKTALLAAQDALVSSKILTKGDVVGYVDDKLGHHTPVVVTKDVTAVGWAGLTTKLSFAAGDVPHTAEAGTQVGTLTVGDGSGGAVEVPVALRTDLVEPGFTDKLTRVG